MTQELPTVLVVEDDTQLADLFGEFIPNTFSTEIVYSAGEAIDRLKPSIEVLILDRELDDHSGSDVVDYAESNEIDCRVIIVSGYDESTADGIDYDAYLQKPVKGAELVGTLEHVIELESGDPLPTPADPLV